MNRPKGPTSHPILGVALEFKKDPLYFLENLAKNFPRITAFKFAHRNMYLVSDPEYIKHLLQTNNKNYRKGTKYDELKHFLGEGLLTSEGDFWRKQRRMAQPSFKKERIDSFAQTMLDDTYEMLNDWKKNNQGKTFDVLNDMMALTLRIIGKTMLSVDFKGESKAIGESLTFLIEATNKRIQTPFNLPLWVPTPTHLRFKKEKKYIDKIINNLIEDRRSGKLKANDLLDMLMSAKDEDTGETMSNQQLRDEIATIFVAGHETTAIALTWSVYLLSQNPEIAQKLKSEIHAISKGEKLKVEDVYKMTYTTQVAEEAMRLYPPAWIMARKALNNDQVDGHNIYKGDDLLISPYVMHRSQAFWNNPLVFDPERFSPEKKKDYHKFLYFPFGGGPRLCIGYAFAMMELQIILSVLYNEVDLKLEKNFVPIPLPLVTLRPNKMPMYYV